MTKKTITITSATILIAVLATTFFIPKDFLAEKEFRLELGLKKAYYFAQNQIANVSEAPQIHIEVPLNFFKQEHPVTCEVAALRTALDYYGIRVSEDELINKLNFSIKEPRTNDNVWGDPDEGFVGSVNGSIFYGTGYGVYNRPIRDLAIKYTGAYIMEEPTLEKVLHEVVEHKRPVIVWGLLSNRTPLYWQSPSGKSVEAFPGEHARVVMGYTGDISNPEKIILMDSLYGRIFMSTEKFLKDWELLKNRTVVLFETPQTKEESDIVIDSLREKILILQEKLQNLERKK